MDIVKRAYLNTLNNEPDGQYSYTMEVDMGKFFLGGITGAVLLAILLKYPWLIAWIGQ